MHKKRDPGRLGKGGESKSSGTESVTREEGKGDPERLRDKLRDRGADTQKGKLE